MNPFCVALLKLFEYQRGKLTIRYSVCGSLVGAFKVPLSDFIACSGRAMLLPTLDSRQHFLPIETRFGLNLNLTGTYIVRFPLEILRDICIAGKLSVLNFH